MSPEDVAQAIVIGSTPEGLGWRRDLLDSLQGCRWQVEVHETRDYELATIAWAAERLDEFVFLPQSTLVKNLRVFDLCFGQWPGYSVNLGTAQGRPFRMYLGKYRRPALMAVGIPPVASKEVAVQLETSWGQNYAAYEDERERLVHLGDPMEHSTHIEMRHGRVNMRVENEYLIRYKGTVLADTNDPPDVREAIRWMGEKQRESVG